MALTKYKCERCGQIFKQEEDKWSMWINCVFCDGGRMFPIGFKPDKAPLKSIDGGSKYI